MADTFTTTTVQLPASSALNTLAIHPDSCKGEQAEVTATNGFGGTDWQVIDDLYWCYASGSITGITSGYNDQCIASGLYNCVGRVSGTYGSRSAYVDWVSTSYGYGLAQEWTEWQVNETGIGEYYPWIQSYGRADGSYYAPGSATNRTH